MATILTDSDALARLTDGAYKVTGLLTPNYGPNGRNTIYDQKYDIPLVINTGEKILSDFSLENTPANTGAALLKDALLKVAHETGDGTIGTAIMAEAVLKKGRALLATGVNPIRLRSGIHKFVPVIEKKIRSMAVPAEDVKTIKKIAVAAADGADLGEMVADAFQAMGKDGMITVADSQAPADRLEICNGIKYDYGLVSSSFINDPVKRSAVFQHSYILLVNQKISEISEIEKILDEVMRLDVPLVIIAESIDETVTNILLTNISRGVFQLAVADAPGHGEIRRRNMQALAARLGAVLVDAESGIRLKDRGLEICGHADSVTIDKDTTLIEGLSHSSASAVATLKQLLQTGMEEDGGAKAGELEKWRTTRAILEGRTATIYAGGFTEYEMFERKHQFENAVSAVYSAFQTGIVPGGGRAYLAVLPVVENLLKTCGEEDSYGLLCIKEALLAPARTIHENTGGADIALDTDIFDPAGVVCLSFQVAATIAATILTAGAAVISEKKS